MALQSGEFARPGVLGTTEVPTYRPPWDAVKLWEGIEARSVHADSLPTKPSETLSQFNLYLI